MNTSPRIVNLVSLFDGIGGSRYALEKLGFKIATYYSYEINKYAIQILDRHYKSDPIMHMGDVKEFNLDELSLNPSYPTVFTAGSPCQSFSNMGKGLGLDDPRGNLFLIAANIFYQIDPDYWFFENVKMSTGFLKSIQRNTGLPDPILLNSADFSPQKRLRYYWTNLPKPIPARKDTRTLGDCLVSRPTYLHKHYPNATFDAKTMTVDLPGVNNRQSRVYSYWQKCPTVIASGRSAGRIKCMDNDKEGTVRFLNPEDIEVAMGYDVGYTKGVSNTQRYALLGNSFQIDTITELLRGIDNVR